MVNTMINPCVFGGAQCLNLTQGIKSEAALDLGCIQNFFALTSTNLSAKID